MKYYDYVIVGAGFFGATFAERAKRDKKSVLIIDKRNHIAGNCYTSKTKNGINVHEYGPHIFHTNDDRIWKYVNRFAKFNNFTYRPKVSHEGQLYSFPINLMTLYQKFGFQTPDEAVAYMNGVKANFKENPYRNYTLEEWAIGQVGEELYRTFIYGYTKKQWNREPKQLPSSIFKRIPIRTTFNDNYFDDKYQGIPIAGYTSLVENMIDGCDVRLSTNFDDVRTELEGIGRHIVYTGPIDAFFNYQYGALDYRSLRFEKKIHYGDFQGNAAINYTDEKVPYTRIIEHRHFDLKPAKQNEESVITYEYPQDYVPSLNEPLYPIDDQFVRPERYSAYLKLTKDMTDKYIFGGRLAEYRYYDMHQVIASALKKYEDHKKTLRNI